MAQFQAFHGDESLIDSIPIHDGYAYFTDDSHKMFLDAGSSRYQINAYSAEQISNGVTTVEIDDIMLKDMVASVSQGGTGLNNLTVNALLVGNGTNAVKLLTLDNGAIAKWDSTLGLTSLLGTGTLYAQQSGSPQFGVAPIAVGGTGASDASAARQNLDVYSKDEVDGLIPTDVGGTSFATYTATLHPNNWISQGSGNYQFRYSNSSLKCGENGDIPPIIYCTDNEDEYNNISDAEATVGVGITFLTQGQPSASISITIIDAQ